MVDPASGLPMPLPNAANNLKYTPPGQSERSIESYDHVLAGPSIGLLPRVVQQDYATTKHLHSPSDLVLLSFGWAILCTCVGVLSPAKTVVQTAIPLAAIHSLTLSPWLLIYHHVNPRLRIRASQCLRYQLSCSLLCLVFVFFPSHGPSDTPVFTPDPASRS